MMALVLTSFLVAQPQGGRVVSVEELSRILRAEAFPAGDLGLVYEGTLRDVGSGDPNPAASGLDFQGIFLLRSDASGMVDLYQRPLSPDAGVVRNKTAVLKDILERAPGLLDANRPLDRESNVARGRGGLLSLPASHTPLQIWRALALRHAAIPERCGYVQEGWEVVDGRNCLVFKTSLGPGAKAEEGFQRYWIDLERGANVLKFELHAGGKRTLRLTGVALRSFRSAGGRTVWIPVRGRVEGFRWRDAIRDEPVTVATITVDEGSVQLDQDLPDEVFTVVRAARTPPPKSLERINQLNGELRLARSFRRQ